MIQAPIGGIVSRVNDQFYKGGQFLPDTGLFCGVTRANLLKEVNRVLAQRCGFHRVVRWHCGGFRYQYRHSAFASWRDGALRSDLIELANLMKMSINCADKRYSVTDEYVEPIYCRD